VIQVISGLLALPRMIDKSAFSRRVYFFLFKALIIAELEDTILTFELELRETFVALADLDCILSFAGVAIDLGYVRPQMVQESENCIQIVHGRHPLQETILHNSFIPNDTNITSTTRLSILTGPNFSGKSCYARQVGILVYMAHIGAFIPCDAARISVHNQIFARFSTVETCAVPQSSFQLDLSEMGTILRRAGRGSLVVIDEFGKGTSPASGIALLAAALKKLASNEFCKVICTTHFLEVFSMCLLSDGVDGVKALSMDVQIPETTKDTAAPLFKLKEGVASSSAGLVCAEMAGVKRAVIDRAAEIVAAVKGRRQVQPLAEILRGNLFLSESAKDTLDQFVRTDWTKASDNDIDRFLHKVHRM
jgi:DNA mismatch repair protein MSH5